MIKLATTPEDIDIEYCSENSIIVACCDDRSSNAVAELTIGLIVSVNRKILDGVEVLKSGWWVKGAFANCLGLKDSTLGLVGFGKVAKKVC